MNAAEIVAKIESKGIKLRINPTDGKLTAIPRRKVLAEHLELLRKHRAAIMEFIEDRDGTGEPLTIEDLPPKDPPKPTVAQQIIALAKAQGIILELDHSGADGVLKVTTPWIEHPAILVNDKVPNGVEMPSEEYVNMQRMQIPTALACQIASHNREIVEYLRAPFMPKLEDAPAHIDPSKRSIWERMAQPDNLIPGAADNRAKVQKLLFGDPQQFLDRRRIAAQNQLDEALPAIIAQAQQRSKK